jgi:hypothetical protein
MLNLQEYNYEYQIGGSLKSNSPSYVVREADIKLYEYLQAGELCYVLDTHQMGKSSLRIRIMERLRAEGCLCASIDLTNIGSLIFKPENWYKAIASELWRAFNLIDKIDFQNWWKQHQTYLPLNRLYLFIEEIILKDNLSTKTFIFFDEIDYLINLEFPIDDFFSLLVYFNTYKEKNPGICKLNFTLFGTIAHSTLWERFKIIPYGLGKSIELNSFQPYEVFPLIRGLEGKFLEPQAVMFVILSWTGGQPFLTQKLCQIVVKYCDIKNIESLSITKFIEKIVREYIINNWSSQDEPQHLRTIRDRILNNKQQAVKLLNCYRNILFEGSSVATNSQEEIELILSGLIVKESNYVKVSNRIYAAAFNLDWVENQLDKFGDF